MEAVVLGAFVIGAIFLLSYSLGTCVDVPDWHERVRTGGIEGASLAYLAHELIAEESHAH